MDGKEWGKGYCLGKCSWLERPCGWEDIGIQRSDINGYLNDFERERGGEVSDNIKENVSLIYEGLTVVGDTFSRGGTMDSQGLWILGMKYRYRMQD